MFEELIYVSHVYRQTRTGVNWRAAVLGEQRLGAADFCPGAQFISHVRSVRPRSSGGIRVDLFFDPPEWFPIPVSREVSSVPGLETPVEFQLAGAGDGRSLVSRLRWALSRAKEEIGLSADIRESRICESPSSAIVQSAWASLS